MFIYGLLVGVLAAYVCVDRVYACTLQYDPVCGSDGKTYANNCFLALKMAKNPQLQLKYKGQCEKHDRKTRSAACSIEITVCGTNSITYRNPCELNRANNNDNKVQLMHLGACNKNSTDITIHDLSFYEDDNVQSLLKKTQYKTEIKNINHTKGNENRPVENNNITNPVPRENPSIELSCPCGLELEDICGKDGVTNDNPCLLNCVATLNNTLQINFEGSCNGTELSVVARTPKREKRNSEPNQKANEHEEDELLCACGRNYLAVCGNNGVSYDNPCLLECAAKNNRSIEIKSIGRCDGKDEFGRIKPKRTITIDGKEYFEDDDVFRREIIAELARRSKRETKKVTKVEHMSAAE